MHLKLHITPLPPTDYCLGSRTSAGRERYAEPEHFGGNLWALDLLAHGGGKNRYLTGSLSWSERRPDIRKTTIKAVCASLESLLFAGLEARDFARPAYYLHEREKGTDVHFCFYQVNLRTGQDVALYCKKRDTPLLNTWMERWNLTKRWTSPLDGACRSLRGTPPQDLSDPPDRQHWHVVDRAIVRDVRSGQCRTRVDIINRIKRSGLEPIVISDEGLVPRSKCGRELTFSGGKYKTGYDFDHANDQVLDSRAIRWLDSTELARIEPQFQAYLETRRQKLQQTFGARAADPHPRAPGERMRMTLWAKKAPKKPIDVPGQEKANQNTEYNHESERQNPLARSVGEVLCRLRANAERRGRETIDRGQKTGALYEAAARSYAVAGAVWRTISASVGENRAIGEAGGKPGSTARSGNNLETERSHGSGQSILPGTACDSRGTREDFERLFYDLRRTRARWNALIASRAARSDELER
jgi:hypothetical protein